MGLWRRNSTHDSPAWRRKPILRRATDGLRLLATCRLCRALLAAGLLLAGPGRAAEEAPRIVAALEQGEAVERGFDGRRRPKLALALYCDAGLLGSAEGFFRVGRLLRERGSALFSPALANGYLALAARLGHRAAAALHDPAIANAEPLEDCGDFAQLLSEEEFDLDGYLSGLSPLKRRIAALIRRQAPRFDVDARFALGVALAESNLNHLAVSPKNAQGVMQLIPDTQQRFGVYRPFDPESNVRGALTYLRWLTARFGGDMALVAAAYNAGEGMVEKYRGVPPFSETRQYVRRVFYFSGYEPPE